MTPKELLKLAENARKNAYAPYSGFSVGAALLCRSGAVYVGCNIENASYTPTCCAERVAIFSAVAQGERDFEQIAVAGGRTDGELQFCTPCGVCRQVMAEFFTPETRVILRDGSGEPIVYSMDELLPHAFALSEPKEKHENGETE